MSVDQEYIDIVLRDLRAAEASRRSRGAQFVVHQVTGSALVIAELEKLIYDDNPIMVTLPDRYGELRYLVARALASERRAQGNLQPLHLPEITKPVSKADLIDAARAAGLPPVPDEIEAYLGLFRRLRDAKKLPQLDTETFPLPEDILNEAAMARLSHEDRAFLARSRKNRAKWETEPRGTFVLSRALMEKWSGAIGADDEGHFLPLPSGVPTGLVLIGHNGNTALLRDSRLNLRMTMPGPVEARRSSDFDLNISVLSGEITVRYRLNDAANDPPPIPPKTRGSAIPGGRLFVHDERIGSQRRRTLVALGAATTAATVIVDQTGPADAATWGTCVGVLSGSLSVDGKSRLDIWPQSEWVEPGVPLRLKPGAKEKVRTVSRELAARLLDLAGDAAPWEPVPATIAEDLRAGPADLARMPGTVHDLRGLAVAAIAASDEAMALIESQPTLAAFLLVRPYLRGGILPDFGRGEPFQRVAERAHDVLRRSAGKNGAIDDVWNQSYGKPPHPIYCGKRVPDAEIEALRNERVAERLRPDDPTLVKMMRQSLSDGAPVLIARGGQVHLICGEDAHGWIELAIDSGATRTVRLDDAEIHAIVVCQARNKPAASPAVGDGPQPADRARSIAALSLEEPFFLIYESGNEHNPMNRYGRVVLQLFGDGRVFVDNIFPGAFTRSWEGLVERATIERILSRLEESRFPLVDQHTIPFDATFRTLVVRSGTHEAHCHPIEWSAALTMKGYADAFRLLDSITATVSMGGIPVVTASESGLARPAETPLRPTVSLADAYTFGLVPRLMGIAWVARDPALRQSALAKLERLGTVIDRLVARYGQQAPTAPRDQTQYEAWVDAVSREAESIVSGPSAEVFALGRAIGEVLLALEDGQRERMQRGISLLVLSRHAAAREAAALAERAPRDLRERLLELTQELSRQIGAGDIQESS